MQNCTSLALKLEEAIDPRETPDVSEGISEMAMANNRRIREIKDENSPLENGEWRILFLGYWDSVQILFGFRMSVRDYHFVLQQDDGSWVQCDRGTQVVPANVHDLIASAEKGGIEHRFFAVSKIAEP